MRRVFRHPTRVVTDRKGVTAAEYAILAVGIVIIVGGAVTAFKPQLANAFTGISSQISAQQSGLSSG